MMYSKTGARTASLRTRIQSGGRHEIAAVRLSIRCASSSGPRSGTSSRTGLSGFLRGLRVSICGARERLTEIARPDRILRRFSSRDRQKSVGRTVTVADHRRPL